MAGGAGSGDRGVLNKQKKKAQLYPNNKIQSPLRHLALSFLQPDAGLNSLHQRWKKIQDLSCAARRSRILNRSLTLPVSFLTAAHRAFCWRFHCREFSPVSASCSGTTSTWLWACSSPLAVLASKTVTSLRLVEPRRQPLVGH